MRTRNFEAGALKTVFFEAAVKGRPGEPEFGCGLGDVAVVLFEDLPDEDLFDFFQVELFQVDLSVVLRARGREIEVLRLQYGGIAENDCPFDGVLEFTDIPWPGMFMHTGECAFTYFINALLIFLRVVF